MFGCSFSEYVTFCHCHNFTVTNHALSQCHRSNNLTKFKYIFNTKLGHLQLLFFNIIASKGRNKNLIFFTLGITNTWTIWHIIIPFLHNFFMDLHMTWRVCKCVDIWLLFEVQRILCLACGWCCCAWPLQRPAQADSHHWGPDGKPSEERRGSCSAGARPGFRGERWRYSTTKMTHHII